MLTTMTASTKQASENDAYSYSLEFIYPAFISAIAANANGCTMKKNTIMVPLNQYFSGHAYMLSESCPNKLRATRATG
jgi:hypothetical protein